MKLLSLLLAGSLAVQVYGHDPDIAILRKLNSPDRLASDNFFRFISNSDPYLVLSIPVGLTFAGYTGKNETLLKRGLICMAAVASTEGIAIVLKYAVNRKRPFETYSDITQKCKANTPSFPSGHTAGSFAVATTLSINWPRWYIIAPSFAWAGTVGYSRMHLGVHYPSDVLAGAIIGSGCAWLTHVVNKKLAVNWLH